MALFIAHGAAYVFILSSFGSRRVGGPLAADAEEIEQQQPDSQGDRRVGDIEDVEGPLPDVEVEEIGDLAVDHPVERIAGGAADADGEAGADHGRGRPPPPD